MRGYVISIFLVGCGGLIGDGTDASVDAKKESGSISSDAGPGFSDGAADVAPPPPTHDGGPPGDAGQKFPCNDDASTQCPIPAGYCSDNYLVSYGPTTCMNGTCTFAPTVTDCYAGLCYGCVYVKLGDGGTMATCDCTTFSD
jgi:hypothetical protein